MPRTKLIHPPPKSTDSNTGKCDRGVLKAKEEKNSEKWTQALKAPTGNISPIYYHSCS